jgi:hypothetical protein
MEESVFFKFVGLLALDVETVIPGSFLPENQLLFFHPRQGYLDYSSLGVERIELDAQHVVSKKQSSPKSAKCMIDALPGLD